MIVETMGTTPAPEPAAFFDLDRTIIPGSSMSDFGFAAWRAGIIDPLAVWPGILWKALIVILGLLLFYNFIQRIKNGPMP